LEKIFELIAPLTQGISDPKTLATAQISIMVFGGFIIGCLSVFLYYISRGSSKRKGSRRLELEVARSKDDYRRLQSDKDKILASYTALKDDNQKVVDEYRLLKKENERLRAMLEEERKRPASGMIFNREEIKRLKDENKKLGDDINELSKQNQKLVDQMDELRRNAERHISSSNHKLGLEIDEFKNRIKIITEQNSELKESIRVERHNHIMEVKTLRDECERLRSEMSKIRNEEAKIVKKLNEEKKEIIDAEKEKFEREKQLLLESIGFVEEAQKEDLKQIRGIGPFIEKKLHTIGVYTIGQIARFTKDDIERATKLIKYFPGRIERDNWIFQAKEIIRVRERKLEIIKKFQ